MVLAWLGLPPPLTSREVGFCLEARGIFGKTIKLWVVRGEIYEHEHFPTPIFWWCRVASKSSLFPFIFYHANVTMPQQPHSEISRKCTTTLTPMPLSKFSKFFFLISFHVNVTLQLFRKVTSPETKGRRCRKVPIPLSHFPAVPFFCCLIATTWFPENCKCIREQENASMVI